ncbi:hypothetical protein F5B20DRAFT_544379 [Whalleya microplaca]|nr:hypothetical protein F5B20DRAFT_544379 [Whalleya microplaca]
MYLPEPHSSLCRSSLALAIYHIQDRRISSQLNAAQRSSSQHQRMTSQSSGVYANWPLGQIPVELFVSIAQFLGSREDVQTMRLVNREFYSKLAGYYFRNLVVHLGPELIPTTLDTGLPLQVESPVLDVTNAADSLADSTFIFRTFGPEIRRFGLALELNESDLATPNVPDFENLETRPWGMYRWPSPLCVAQSLTDKITQSLEGSEGIFRILSHLSGVQELALSCEGGLGYLQGPDINPLSPSRRTAIFGDPNIVRDDGNTPNPPLDFDVSYKYEMLTRRMHSAGVDHDQIPAAIDTIMSTEHITREQLDHEDRPRCPPPGTVLLRTVPTTCKTCNSRSRTLRLQPDMLTESQKRFLLLHMSAQQALIQSYVLGILDNGSSFMNLTKLKISRLPSFHIELLCRADFWANLPRLEDVLLAIVPDWRTVASVESYAVDERQVYPTDAMPKVFRLLNDHIGQQKQIKRLHFEWLCGGELAPGQLQRNNHILPAPFLKEHRKIKDSRVENLLILPFIAHLSLKNCWFTPNVFFRIIRKMAEESLESLELETVSLSGSPCKNRQTENRQVMLQDDVIVGPAAVQGAETSLTALQAEMEALDQAASAEISTDFHSYNVRLPEPRTLSWAHIIDMLTPGDTIREQIHEQGRDEDDPPLRLKKQLKLRVLDFKSCGYVSVPDYRFISEDPLDTLEQPRRRIIKGSKVGCIEWFMQASNDRHLARVINHIKRGEEYLLGAVFGFKTGWRGVYARPVIKAAIHDGIPHPGRGRFSGRIEHHWEPTPVERYSGVFYEEEDGENVQLVENYDTSVFDRDYDDNDGLDELLRELESVTSEARHGDIPNRSGWMNETGLLTVNDILNWP